MSEPSHYLPSFATVQAYIDSEGGRMSEPEFPTIEEPSAPEVELTEEESDWLLIEEACQWCPQHHSKECSPIRNGCGIVDQQRQALKRRREAADDRT